MSRGTISRRRKRAGADRRLPSCGRARGAPRRTRARGYCGPVYPGLMSLEWVRKQCLALPHTTEQVQWVDHLLFKIGGKVYAITGTQPSPIKLSLKADPEEFAELCERPGVIPAPYLARAKWVALEEWDALPRGELKELLAKSYQLVKAGLPKNVRAKLTGPVRKRGVRESPSPATPAKPSRVKTSGK